MLGAPSGEMVREFESFTFHREFLCRDNGHQKFRKIVFHSLHKIFVDFPVNSIDNQCCFGTNFLWKTTRRTPIFSKFVLFRFAPDFTLISMDDFTPE